MRCCWKSSDVSTTELFVSKHINNWSRCWRLLLLGVSLGLAACSSPETILREGQIARGPKEKVEEGVFTQPIEGEAPEPVDDPEAVWRERRAELLTLENWTAFGKLALRSEGDAWAATLYWRQLGDEFRIRLTGPFGGGGLQVEGDPSSVELRTADNKVYTATDAEELLYQHVGWRMPLAGLRYWILGRVEPSAPVEKVFIDVAGRVVRFNQLGWKVNYLDYRDIDQLAMPRKATLKNDRVRASVLISRWKLEEQQTE